jgi:Icc protein
MLVQLSDLHVRVGAGDGRAARRLAATVEAVAALDPRPDAVLLSGDLVDVPSAAAYERVRELLAPLALPLHAVPGNHDDRDALRAAFAPGMPAAAGAPVRSAVTCGPLRLVACDTSRPGRDDGRLDDDELDWLDATLQADPATPTVVAMHHPPVLTGHRAADEIGLPERDRAALGALLEHHRHVGLLVAGHAHRTMAASLAGRPVLICPSTDLQPRLDLRPGGDHRVELTDDPPGFAVHVLLGDRLASHVQPVGPFVAME